MAFVDTIRNNFHPRFYFENDRKARPPFDFTKLAECKKIKNTKDLKKENSSTRNNKDLPCLK